MGFPELYNLEWDEFQNHAGKMLKNLLNDQNFTDVTLACEGDKQINAHKLVLSSSSPFFHNLLMKNPHPSPLIYLRGVNFTELKSLIKFIYHGQTEVLQDELDHFMEVAQELKIQGLLGDSDSATVYENSSKDQRFLKEGFESTENSKRGENIQSIKHEPEVQSKYFQQRADSTETQLEDRLYPSPPRFNFNEALDAFDDIDMSDTKSEENSKEVFGCDHCQFKTKSSSSLNRHQRLLHTSSRQKYRCDLCDKVFSMSHGLAKHKKTAHDGKKYNCNKCGFEAVGEYRLKVHEKKMHTE